MREKELKWKKLIKDLEKQKKKALDKLDFIEAAKLCNVIGETLSSNGFYEEAIDAHSEETEISQTANDVIGVAVGNRKVGECLCELRRFEEAISHQKQHLKLAKSVGNVLEQQRALATLGRTYFVQTEDGSDEAAINVTLMKSQKAYLKSLELCNQLNINGNISQKDFLEMKARLYLNLGLVYDMKHDYSEALKFVNKALVISNEQKLKDDIYRCHFTLSGLYVNQKEYQKALQSAKSAVMIAKQEHHQQEELDAQSQIGLIWLKLGEFNSTIQSLKRVYKASKGKHEADSLVLKNIRLGIRGMKLHKQYEECENKKELMNICEKLGDFYHDVGSPEKALEYYEQQLSVAQSLGISGGTLAQIYISIAVTHSDCKQHERALEFYEKELQLRQGELKEKSSTYCAMAKCLEDLHKPLAEIKTIYMKALQCAEGSGNRKAMLKVYRDWSETLKVNSAMNEEYENVVRKMSFIEKEMEDHDEEESTSQDTQLEDTNDEMVDELNSEELEMLESEGELDDEEENHLSSTATTSRKTSREAKKKTKKVNERGETPLHVASINGNVEKARELLKIGADVHARDYCGWQPIHEACNHGHIAIVKLLIEHGANINDPGGKHCGGITPLHDASQNGHVEVVRVLLEHNADVYAKCHEGYTPLQLVTKAIRSEEEEISSSNNSENSMLSQRKKVEVLLRKMAKKRKETDRTQTSKTDNRNRMLFENSSGESDDEEAVERIPSKRVRLERGETSIPPVYSVGLIEEESPPVETEFPIQENEISTRDSEIPLGNSEEVPIEDDDSNYGSMTEDNFPMSPPVLFVDENSCDSITSELARGNAMAVENQTSPDNKNTTDARRNFTSREHRSSSGRKHGQMSKKSYKNKVQSRISFSRSPSPRARSSSPAALLNENDVLLRDFIIDDMSKKSNKKERQSRIGFPTSDSSRIINDELRHSEARTSNSKRTQQSASKKKSKQTKINTYTEVDIREENIEEEPVILHNNTTSENRPSHTFTGPLFRIKVRITGRCFLIPCQQADTMTIDWLTKQAVERYCSETGVATRLTLTTKDGAHLNAADVISNVVENNEEICGEVIGLKFPPILEQYKKKCEENEIDPLSGICEQFSLEEELRSLSIADVFLTKKDIDPIFSSLSCNTCIVKLDLTGIFIGDENFGSITSVLSSMPALSSLNLSSTGLTTKSLMNLSKVADSPPKEEYKLFMKDSPLSQLRSLNFSYNTLNDEETFSIAMATIIHRCLCLEELVLSNCALRHTCFNNRSIRVSCIESNLKVLNLSNNRLGEWSDVTSVISLFNVSSLQSLDISSTTSSLSENISIDSLIKILQTNQCRIQDLQLNRLPAISPSTSTISLNVLPIRSLSIKHQPCSGLFMKALVRDVEALPNLESFDCSSTKSFDENILIDFLEQLKKYVSPIEKISLTSCNICSRLPENLFGLLSDTALRRIKYMDLSFNEITHDDKTLLASSWQQNRRTCDINVNGRKCLLIGGS